MPKQSKTIHERFGQNRDYIAMAAPLLLMAFYYHGPRVLVLALAAVLTARITDRLAAMMRGRLYNKTENSSTVIALVIVLMLPATVQYRVVVAAVLVAVLVAKEAFGGAGSYPFNPAAVGFCAVAVSWPAQVFSYPVASKWLLNPPQSWEAFWKLLTLDGAALTTGLSATLRGGALPSTDPVSLLLGDFPGPLGTTATLVVVSCALYLVVKHRLPLGAPLSFLGVSALIAFLFPRYSEIGWHTFPQDMAARGSVVMYELLGGAFMFAAVFCVIYGALLGFTTMMFRYFGNYELGACFAFLIVNAVSGYFDRAVARRSAAKKGAALP